NMEWVQLKMNQLGLVAEFKPVEGSQPVGEVLTQSVESNVSLPQGSIVTFTYSDGEKLLEKTVTFRIPPMVGTVVVEVYLDDQIIFESDLAGDYGQVSMPVYAKAGKYNLRIYIDGRLLDQREITFQ
ncbi:MAG: hypothetical protein IKC03_05325, partial [Oscillospiraceae bacterium]|nr:hypothetical protein [Oscillospiraceae bacterium]